MKSTAVASRTLWRRTRDNTLMESLLYPDITSSGDGMSIVEQSVEMVHFAMIDSSLKTRAATAHGQKGPRCTFLDVTRFVSLLLTRAHQQLTNKAPAQRILAPRGGGGGAGGGAIGHGPDANDIIAPAGVVSSDNIALPSVALRTMFRRSIEHDADVLAQIRVLYQQLAAAGCTSLDQRLAVANGDLALTVPKDLFTSFIKEVVKSFLGPTLLEFLDQIPMVTVQQKQTSPRRGRGGSPGDPDVDGRKSQPPSSTTAAADRCRVGIPVSIALGEWCAARISPVGPGGSRRTTATGKKLSGGVEEVDFVRRLVEISLLASSEDYSMPVNLKECVQQFLTTVCAPAASEVSMGSGMIHSLANAQFKVPKPPADAFRFSGDATTDLAVIDAAHASPLQAEGHRGRHMHSAPPEEKERRLEAPPEPKTNNNFTVRHHQQGKHHKRHTRGQHDQSPSQHRSPRTNPHQLGTGKMGAGEHTVPNLPGIQQPHSQYLVSLQQHDRGNTAPPDSGRGHYHLVDSGETLPRMIGVSGTAAIGPEALEMDGTFMANCGTTIGLQPLETNHDAMSQNLILGRTNSPQPSSGRTTKRWRPPTKASTVSLAKRADRWKEKGLHRPPNPGGVGDENSGKSLILSVVNEKTALGRRVRLAELFPIGAKTVQMTL